MPGLRADPPRIIWVGLGTLLTGHVPLALMSPFTPTTLTARVLVGGCPWGVVVVTLKLPAFGWPSGITSMFEIGLPSPQNCM
jgi:hypothetical protein